MALWLASIEHGQVLVLGASGSIAGVRARVQIPPHRATNARRILLEAELDALHGELYDDIVPRGLRRTSANERCLRSRAREAALRAWGIDVKPGCRPIARIEALLAARLAWQSSSMTPTPATPAAAIPADGAERGSGRVDRPPLRRTVERWRIVAGFARVRDGAAFQNISRKATSLAKAIREIRGEIADAQTAQRSEIEALKLAHGKLVNENQALRLVLENLRVHSATKGASTAIEGRLEEMAFKVQLGLAASVANVARSLPAARIVSWEIDDNALVAYPLLRADIEGQRCA